VFDDHEGAGGRDPQQDAGFESVQRMVRDKKPQEEITTAVIKEFNWGFGPSAGNIAGMMQELR
jgi:hypothetical protein